MNPPLPDIWRQGLWDNNPGLVQLLGLCPLLAVSGTLVNGLGLGLATLAVVTLTNLTVSSLRGLLRPEIRIPAFVLIIAAMVTAVELLVRAYLPGLSKNLGIFLPLIVTNCAIIGRAEAFASRQPVWPALHDGLATGTGFALVLVALGGARELLGQGSLLAGADLLTGGAFDPGTWQVLPDDWQFLLAVLPPGAFILLGLMVAAHQALRAQRRTAPATEPAPSTPETA